MKILKRIGIVLGALIVLLLLIALFVPKPYAVSRSVTISRTPTDVINYVRYLKNSDQYNKWVMMDPAMQKSFRGSDGEKGFVYA